MIVSRRRISTYSFLFNVLKLYICIRPSLKMSMKFSKNIVMCQARELNSFFFNMKCYLMVKTEVCTLLAQLLVLVSTKYFGTLQLFSTHTSTISKRNFVLL